MLIIGSYFYFDKESTMKDSFTGVELAQTKYAMSAAKIYTAQDVYLQHVKQVLNEKVELITMMQLRSSRSYLIFITSLTIPILENINRSSDDFKKLEKHVKLLQLGYGNKDTEEAMEFEFIDIIIKHRGLVFTYKMYEDFFDRNLL